MIQFSNKYIPKFSFQVKNLNSPIHNNDEEVISESQMRPVLVYQMYSRLGIGYDIKTNWGIFNAELNAPYNNAFQDLYNEYISGSIGYSLSRFSTLVSYLIYQQAFAFNFGSKVASIGIFDGTSRPLGDFSAQKGSLAGVRGEVSFLKQKSKENRPEVIFNQYEHIISGSLAFMIGNIGYFTTDS